MSNDETVLYETMLADCGVSIRIARKAGTPYPTAVSVPSGEVTVKCETCGRESKMHYCFATLAKSTYHYRMCTVCAEKVQTEAAALRARVAELTRERDEARQTQKVCCNIMQADRDRALADLAAERERAEKAEGELFAEKCTRDAHTEAAMWETTAKLNAARAEAEAAKAKLRHVCEIMATLGNPGLKDVLLEMHEFLFPESKAIREKARAAGVEVES